MANESKDSLSKKDRKLILKMVSQIATGLSGLSGKGGMIKTDKIIKDGVKRRGTSRSKPCRCDECRRKV